jgi:thiol-disulfide isomerase/thioredoxin
VKKAAPWVLAGLCVATVVTGVVLQSRQAARAGPPASGSAFTEPFTLQAVHGEVALVNLWATWCAPCRREIPELLALAQVYEPKGVRFVAVNTDDGGRDSVEAFLRTQPKSLKEHLAYPSDAFMTEVGLEALPTTLIVDKQGRVVKRFRGAIHADEVKAALDAVLAKSTQITR